MKTGRPTWDNNSLFKSSCSFSICLRASPYIEAAFVKMPSSIFSAPYLQHSSDNLVPDIINKMEYLVPDVRPQMMWMWEGKETIIIHSITFLGMQLCEKLYLKIKTKNKRRKTKTKTMWRTKIMKIIKRYLILNHLKTTAADTTKPNIDPWNCRTYLDYKFPVIRF